MGQRSQIYIRYNNGKTMVAEHLQWNYGEFMIDRAEQILDFLSKNVEEKDYSNFIGKYFEITNRDYSRNDLDILKSLIELNINKGSIVKGADLVKEALDMQSLEKNPNFDTFKITPEMQDNNNGIFVVDIKNNGEIKYGFAIGPEEMSEEEYNKWNKDKNMLFKMCSAKEYIEHFSPEHWSEKYIKDIGPKKFKEEQTNYSLYLEKAEKIDRNFSLMTDKEYEEMFDREYEYKDCMKQQEYEETKKQVISERYKNLDPKIKEYNLIEDYRQKFIEYCKDKVADLGKPSDYLTKKQMEDYFIDDRLNTVRCVLPIYNGTKNVTVIDSDNNYIYVDKDKNIIDETYFFGDGIDDYEILGINQDYNNPNLDFTFSKINKENYDFIVEDWHNYMTMNEVKEDEEEEM